MASCSRRTSMLLLFVCFALSLPADSSYVPVLFIGSDLSPLSQSSFSAVEKVSYDEFQNNYIKKLEGKGPLIVFQQDTLSPEDFGFYGNIYGEGGKTESFQSLKALTKQYPSLFLPGVENAKKSIEKVYDNWKIIKTSKDHISELSNIEITPSTLIYFKLPDTILASDRGIALRDNDKVIGKVVQNLEKLSQNFTVVFTADRSSWAIDQEEHVRISRHILEVPANDTTIIGIFYNNSNIIFHSYNITFVRLFNDTHIEEIPLVGNDANMSADKENDTIRFSIQFQNIGARKLQSLSISFLFKQTPMHWYVSALTLTVNDGVSTMEENLKSDEIWTPNLYSYTCKELGKIINRETLNNTQGLPRNTSIGIRFDSIQIQPFFNASADKFGAQFDCVGFFTIPIWMTIFVSLILVIILAFGISLLMDINTMDRFDDPKGKTITVPNME